MSRQSKMKRKALAQKKARMERRGRDKPKLSKEQRRLRQQAAQMIELRRQERERQTQEALKRAQRKAAGKERTTKGRSRTSSQTSAPDREGRQVVVTPYGTLHYLKSAVVVNRGAVHVKTYPAGTQVRFLSDGRAAIVQPDQPPVLLDLETGLETRVEA